LKLKPGLVPQGQEIDRTYSTDAGVCMGSSAYSISAFLLNQYSTIWHLTTMITTSHLLSKPRPAEIKAQ